MIRGGGSTLILKKPTAKSCMCVLLLGWENICRQQVCTCSIGNMYETTEETQPRCSPGNKRSFVSRNKLLVPGGDDELRGVLFWSAWVFVLALEAAEQNAPRNDDRQAGPRTDAGAGEAHFVAQGMFHGGRQLGECGLHLSMMSD